MGGSCAVPRSYKLRPEGLAPLRIPMNIPTSAEGYKPLIVVYFPHHILTLILIHMLKPNNIDKSSSSIGREGSSIR